MQNFWAQSPYTYRESPYAYGHSLYVCGDDACPIPARRGLPLVHIAVFHVSPSSLPPVGTVLSHAANLPAASPPSHVSLVDSSGRAVRHALVRRAYVLGRRDPTGRRRRAAALLRRAPRGVGGVRRPGFVGHAVATTGRRARRARPVLPGRPLLLREIGHAMGGGIVNARNRSPTS
jgi:hypothetical protein